MKITIENALAEYPKYRDKMPNELNETFDNPKFPMMFRFYGKNEKITEMLDEWIKNVNANIKDDAEKDKPAKKQTKFKVTKFKVGDVVIYKGTQECEIIDAYPNGTYNLQTRGTILPVTMMSVSESDIALKSGGKADAVATERIRERLKRKPKEGDPKVKLSDFPKACVFLNDSQKVVIRKAIEEYEDCLRDTERSLNELPKLYEQDGKGMKAIAYAHLFNSTMDFYVTEFDGQDEVFGLFLGHGMDSELGHNTLEQLKKHFELDLHFDPKPLSDFVMSDEEKKREDAKANKKPTSKPAKQKKEKKAKQQKQKFKVGDYVKWFDGAFNHVGIIVKGRTEDDNVYYTDGYEIRYESDGRKCIGVSESFLSKASKKEYDKAEKAYIESKKEPVASFPLEYSLLKRYIWLNDKKMSVARAHKSNNPEAILRAIQNAIGQKKIRKESKYANEIMTAQKQLIKLLRDYDRKEITGSTIIGIDGYEACKAVVDSMRVDDISKISTNFISKVQEKENRKTEAQNILAKLNELNETGDNKELVASMKKSIQDYIDGKTDKVESIERQLRGVLGSIQKRGMRGLGSLVGDVPSEDNTISSEQLLKAKFETLPFTGRWESFFGEPSRNFKAMIYGRAGSGKSTFAIQFAKYLSKDLGLKVLYIASEEKFGHTLQEKVRRFNVANDNIAFADKLPLDITKYDVVFFDSVNDMKIEPAELMEMTANIASVGIFQCTKTGTFRGGEDFAHDVDIVVEVEDMVASTTKNRFQAGSMQFSVR